MVFPASDYNDKLLYCTDESYCSIDNSFATGADKWRYSFDYGGTWSEWTLYTESLNTTPDILQSTWEGVHIMVQYWSALTQSISPTVHADALYSGGERRNPFYLARGNFNKWGLDAGMTMNLENNNNLDEGWTLAVSPRMPSVLIPFSAHDTMASQYPAQRVWK
jgi:alpha-1,3-glucan synthase